MGNFPFGAFHARHKAFVEFGELDEIAVDFEVPKEDSLLVIELSLS